MSFIYQFILGYLTLLLGGSIVNNFDFNYDLKFKIRSSIILGV